MYTETRKCPKTKKNIKVHLLGYNYEIGRNVRLGKNVIIGDKCVISEYSIIGENTFISNEATVYNSKIGKNCFIGTDVCIFSGAEVRPFTCVPAHADIPSGAIIDNKTYYSKIHVYDVIYYKDSKTKKGLLKIGCETHSVEEWLDKDILHSILGDHGYEYGKTYTDLSNKIKNTAHICERISL
jgi:carbonic anhydrase/acetyltransferase-like protein (isoleucine patch superfamily)